MARSSRRRSNSLQQRCVVFWAAPLALAVLGSCVPALSGNIEGLAYSLVGLLAISIAGFAAELHQGSKWAILQLLLQTVLLTLVCRGWQPSIASTFENVHWAAPVNRTITGGGGSLATLASAVAEKINPAIAKKWNITQETHPEKIASTSPPEVAGNGKISIVLPCLNESQYAVKTVMSFCERTPSDVLEEIIVVDDGSTPPLSELLEPTRTSIPCKLRVLRHDQPWGLMIAKQTGGDAANGAYIGFYDCHVAPVRGWERETLKLLKDSEPMGRRLVVPQIGNLNLDTWDDVPNYGAHAKCYINLNADFWWYDDETDNIPIISGGLVATTKRWWNESGGFDRGMRGWGGENTDQSLRAWLCGGDVVRSRDSRIAHMWRTGDDKRTTAKYHTHFGVNNQARVAAIWFDEFQHKFGGTQSQIDASLVSALKIKRELGCKPFVYFLHRFRRLYIGGNVFPEKVFRIKSRTSGLCITRQGAFVAKLCATATWFQLGNRLLKQYYMPDFDEVEIPDSDVSQEVSCGNHKAKSCSQCPKGNGPSWCHNDCTWVAGACLSHKQAKAARESRKNVPTCCSGIREWNSMDCFDRLDPNGPITYQCSPMGDNENQQYTFTRNGKIKHYSGRCLSEAPGGKKNSRTLASTPCDNATEWETIESFEPVETKLYKAGVRKHGLSDDAPDA